MRASHRVTTTTAILNLMPMGSCVSAHKTPPYSANLNTPHPQIELETPSPFHHAPGSKEEAFFDSHTWLESDCEDDFLSINGDLTPSGESTPIHNKDSSWRKPPPGVVETEESQNKRLSELFKESSRNHLYSDDEIEAASNGNVVPEKGTSDPISHDDGGGGLLDDKSGKCAQCCGLPRLISSHSFSEWKKKASPRPSS